MLLQRTVQGLGLLEALPSSLDVASRFTLWVVTLDSQKGEKPRKSNLGYFQCIHQSSHSHGPELGSLASPNCKKGCSANVALCWERKSEKERGFWAAKSLPRP